MITALHRNPPTRTNSLTCILSNSVVFLSDTLLIPHKQRNALSFIALMFMVLSVPCCISHLIVLLRISFNPSPSLFTLLLQVDITIPSLPALTLYDSLQCDFGSFVNNAVVNNRVQVTCSLPEPGDIPPTPDQHGRWTHGELTECTKAFT